MPGLPDPKEGNKAASFGGDASASKTAGVLKETLWKCEVCSGFGHRYNVCPTKKHLDKWAKCNGDAINWAAWKFETYYKDIGEDQRKLDKEEARKLSGFKRSFNSQSTENSHWSGQKRRKY